MCLFVNIKVPVARALYRSFKVMKSLFSITWFNVRNVKGPFRFASFVCSRRKFIVALTILKGISGKHNCAVLLQMVYMVRLKINSHSIINSSTTLLLKPMVN